MSIFDIGAFNRQLLIMVIVAAGSLLAMWLAQRLLREILLYLFPPSSMETVIISKRLEVKAKSASKKAYTVYYMTFQPISEGFQQGERKEYETPKENYALCVEGDRGSLKLHMGKFMSWVPKNNE